MTQTIARCAWADSGALEAAYHDLEWGVPVHDDRMFFEFLVLEGAQAGLNWSTILRKREGYRRAFANFDPDRVARFDGHSVARLLENDAIVRNRLKVESAIGNARAYVALQRECGSFDRYVWAFIGGEPRQNRWTSPDDVPATTAESDALSADLRRRGFRFVGSTIVYAFMQATGLVNDHLAHCPRWRQVKQRAARR